MKRTAARSHADVDAPMMARRESEAQLVARKGGNAGPASPFAPREHDDRLAGAPGRPLPPSLQRRMQRSLGHDFSMVRVHEDAAAQRVTEDAGARALAYGNDLAFAPGEFAPHKPGGIDLLAHELAHVAQQQASGAQFVARDAKAGEQGIGASPPSESFITMDTAGSEDKHALFDLNSAALSPDSAATLAAAIKDPTGPVTVHVHGYASKEGDKSWNLNLSAHRAVAVKEALEKILPKGSRIVLFAHGATADFGGLANNRRVGVSLIGPVETYGFKLTPSLLPDMHIDLTPKSRSEQPPLDVSKPILPQLGGGVTPWSPTKPDPLAFKVPPPVTRRDKMDLAAIGVGMATHGVSPGAYGDVVALWDAAFLRYKAMGLNDDWAARLANSQVSGTIASQAARDAPNAIDRANADWSAAHPEEKATPILKSPNLFDLFSKKKKE
jgi:outer membrane protein OmpA-like peptidoglycan-associated protein